MNKLLPILIIFLLVLTSCQIRPSKCDINYQIESSRISNDNYLPGTMYVAKSGNVIYFRDTSDNNKQKDIEINFKDKTIIVKEFFNGTKETQTYEENDEEYMKIILDIHNKTKQYLDEAMNLNGYEKEHFISVENYQSCIAKLR